VGRDDRTHWCRLTAFLYEQPAQASPDLLPQMLTAIINTAMLPEVDVVCGAPWGERSEARGRTSSE
jgi:hypothetical protein